MRLTEVVPVADAALPVAALKDHLRLGTGFADDGMQDALLLGYLRAALAAIEGRIGKALITREFSFELPGWRDRVAQALPLAPVTAVTGVTFVTAAGSEVADPAGWRLEADPHRPRLVGVSLLPAVPTGGRVVIAFTAGFGTWEQVPADLRQAVLLLAAQFHEFRHDVAAQGGAMPFGVMALIERWRTVRVLGGGL